MGSCSPTEKKPEYETNTEQRSSTQTCDRIEPTTVPVLNSNAVYDWLITLKLGQYYDLFMKNGFDDMSFVMEIDDKDTLKEMGIALGHRLAIYNGILRLKNPALSVQSDECPCDPHNPCASCLEILSLQGEK